MPKRETPLKAALMKVMRTELPRFVVMRHEDRWTSGIPDFSVDGAGRTSWYEVKHADPEFDSEGIQELTCLRLAVASYCRYVIYYENKDGAEKRTMIVHPKHLHALIPEASVPGYSHAFVAAYIRRVHGC